MQKSADAFRTISEVAEWLGVQAHVLRFWESKFKQVKPVKRAGGRRYYRPADMLLLGGIRKLLHDDGLTIKGVQKLLREEGVAHVADLSQTLDDLTTAQIDASVAPEGALADDAGTEIPPLAPSDTSEAPDDGDETQTTVQVVPSETSATSPVPPTHTAIELEDFGVPGDGTTAAQSGAAEPAGTATDDSRDVSPPETATPDPEDTHAELPTPEVAETPATPELDLATDDIAPDKAAPTASLETTSDTTEKPRVVDAPDGPDPDQIQVYASALTHAIRRRSLSVKQAETLHPLVASLAALRQRMADQGDAQA